MECELAKELEELELQGRKPCENPGTVSVLCFLMTLLVRSLSSALSVSTASSGPATPLPTLGWGQGLGYQLVAPVHKKYICKQWEKARG